MPAADLTPRLNRLATSRPAATDNHPRARIRAIEQAVMDVLAGVPVTTAATRITMSPTDLVAAVAAYRAAGRAALATASRWYQVTVEFASRDQAEHTMASDVWPRLRAAETDGTITAWWYIRKTPHWRLRLHPGQGGTAALAPFIHAVLHDLTCYGLIRRWRPGIYEPETLTFGGRAGIAAAHRLFHADSTHILDHLNHTDTADSPLGRRELSLLLCTALLRAAGQDWHEHGDVWHRVACMRPLPPGASTDRLYRIADHVRLLLSLDTTAPTPRSALVPARPWLAAFTEAGRTLGAAAHTGTLRRGLRDVLAHHIIFHWNRLGLPTTTQAVLAHAAVTATLNPSPPRNPTSDVATT